MPFLIQKFYKENSNCCVFWVLKMPGKPDKGESIFFSISINQIKIVRKMSMFCYQCQEAAKGTGCTIAGVCGKPGDVANLQDTLLFVLKGISWYNEKLRGQKMNPEKVDKFVFDGLFSTITNANFDKNSFTKRIVKALQLRNELHSRCLAINT